MNIFLISLGLIFSIQLNASDNLSGIDSPNLKTVLGRIDTLKQSAFIASTDSTRNDGSIRCFQTPGNDTYIGVEREYIIHAPYENVVSELDRFENYGQLFPEMKKVEVSEKNNDWVKVNFEQKAPLFFVPNTKYALKYQQITCGKDCKIYRFKLQNGNNLKFSDGFMMVTKKDDSSTTFLGLDFFDADWGILKSISKDQIWTQSLRGFIRSDYSVKFKTEKNVSYREAQRLATEYASTFSVKNCLSKKESAETLLTKSK